MEDLEGEVHELTDWFARHCCPHHHDTVPASVTITASLKDPRS